MNYPFAIRTLPLLAGVQLVPQQGHKDDILRKPVPRWPDRRSYASHKRQKGGKR